MIRATLAAVAAPILVAGCATTPAPYYPDVRPSADGAHRTVLSMERKTGDFQGAFRQARDFCGDVHARRPVVVSEVSRYVGTMDEATYNSVKTATQVAMGVGGAVGVLASKDRASNAGFGTAIAGGIGHQVMGAGYEYTLTFRCE
ncbi:MAG: hypothetical protein EHM87_19515 [Burkholderiales bacterium]|nr:MAG: hypothetical protein EHM87_19515 [Burkholderiales bacterium]